METATIIELPAANLANKGTCITEILPCDEKTVKNVTSDIYDEKSSACVDKDALEAVKLDPAVLEAQVTMESSCKLQMLSDNLLNTSFSSNASSNNSQHRESSPKLSRERFEELLSREQAALLSLTPQQFHLLIKYVDTLRRQRTLNQISLECAFCKNNGESFSWYSSHALKDWRGRVLCPVLRAFRCPRCGATGDRAHTIKYCPENHEADLWSL